MALQILDLRISQIWIAAPPAARVAAGGPLAGIGSEIDFPIHFTRTLSGAHRELDFPWQHQPDGALPRSNRFWSKYAIRRMLENGRPLWPKVAWERMTPFRLKQPAMPTLAISSLQKRGFTEAFAWPTCVGLMLNFWLQGEITRAVFEDALKAIDNGSVDVTRSDLTPGAPSGAKTTKKEKVRALCHELLRNIADSIWTAGPHADPLTPMTLITVVRARAEASQTDIDTALADLTKLIGSVMGDNLVASDKRGEGIVYHGRKTLLAWDPSKFTSADPIHTLGCLHRNLIFATLQTQAIAATAQMLANARANGKLSASMESRRRHVLDVVQDMKNGNGYGAPFILSQLNAAPIQGALATLGRP